jgi:O-antigen/teichoic acid export membrane protein
MPVFLLSGGVSMLLFPMTSRWVQQLGVAAAARRLALLVTGLILAAVCYIALMWFTRDWIFSVILKKHFAQRDPLLLLWGVVFLLTLSRDQLSTLPAARARFRGLTLLTGASALVWLAASCAAMLLFGGLGAVVGILIGELVNVTGVILMIRRETSQPGLVSAH